MLRNTKKYEYTNKNTEAQLGIISKVSLYCILQKINHICKRKFHNNFSYIRKKFVFRS